MISLAVVVLTFAMIFGAIYLIMKTNKKNGAPPDHSVAARRTKDSTKGEMHPR